MFRSAAGENFEISVKYCEFSATFVVDFLQLSFWIFYNLHYGFSTTSFSSTQFFLQLTFYFLQLTFFIKILIFFLQLTKKVLSANVSTTLKGGNFMLSVVILATNPPLLLSVAKQGGG